MASSKFHLSRSEIAALIVVIVSLLATLLAIYTGNRDNSQVSTAMERVQLLYQNELIQYFSTGRFQYTLTRTQSSNDFFKARPPSGKAENLVGYTAEAATTALNSNQPRNSRQPMVLRYTNWERLGFPLNEPSYYIYRLEPDFALATEAKNSDYKSAYYHFHAIAVGDIDGDGRYAVLARGGYINREGFYHGTDQLLTAEFSE